MILSAMPYNPARHSLYFSTRLRPRFTWSISRPRVNIATS